MYVEHDWDMRMNGKKCLWRKKNLIYQISMKPLATSHGRNDIYKSNQVEPKFESWVNTWGFLKMNGKWIPYRIKETMHNHRNLLQSPLLQHHHSQDPWSTTPHIFIPFPKWNHSFWVYINRWGYEQHGHKPLSICSLIIVKEIKTAEKTIG